MYELLQAVTLDTDRRGELLEGGLGGNDDGDGLGALLVGVDADVGDDGGGAVDGLELLESNVFSVESLDEVLLAVDDLEMAVLVPLADIAGLEPAVRGESGGSLLGVLVVLGEHRGATEPDLTLGVGLVGGEVAGIGEVDKLGLNGSGHGTDGLSSPFVGVLETAHGGRLGKTIADNHRADSHGDKLLGILGDGATAVQAELHATTGGILDLLEHDSVKKTTSWQTHAHELLLKSKRTPEEVAHDRASSVDLGENALLDSLPDGGNTNQNAGGELADIAEAVAHRGVGKGLGVTVTHGGTPVKAGVLENELENVSEGKVGQEAVTGANEGLDDGGDTSDCNESVSNNSGTETQVCDKLTGSDNVAVLEGHTLGGTSRTRGVHDAAEVLRGGRDRRDGVLLAELDELVEVQDCNAALGPELLNVGILGLVLVVPDNMGDVLGVLKNAVEGREEMGVEEDSLGLGSDHGILETLGAESVVGSHNGHGLGGSTMRHGEPVLACRGEDVDTVAGVEAKGAQTGADVEGALLILLEGDELVVAELEVGPVLVHLALLTIHHLLDLLGLDMRVYELAGAHALRVAIGKGSPLDELVDGSDLLTDGLLLAESPVCGLVVEAVDAGRSAADRSLSLDGRLAGDIESIGGLGDQFGYRRQKRRGSHDRRLL